ncbi:hypothetical protein GCM10010517_62730 [Streptosporangium fragile]|uniref:Uncharacterized protein n=2 Tax=Streptosporangium fragile TaxID=46186 RepID=A0ABN3W7D2_9ACTN
MVLSVLPPRVTPTWETTRPFTTALAPRTLLDRADDPPARRATGSAAALRCCQRTSQATDCEMGSTRLIPAALSTHRRPAWQWIVRVEERPMTGIDYSLLDRDADALYLAIGEALLAGELKSKDADDDEKRETGRAWFEQNLQVFRKAVCTSVRIRKVVFGPGKVERNTLFAALVDTLAALNGFQVPVAVVSAQLIHYGLGRLCPNLGPVETRDE